MVRLKALKSDEPGAINGMVLATLTRRLMGAEMAVGGPYGDMGTVDRGTNLMIADFFRSYGSPLPALERWLGIEPEHDLVIEPASSSGPSDTAKAIRSELEVWEPPLRQAALDVWHKIVRVDSHHEITGITRRFVDSLATAPTISNKRIAQLARANFYAWMAYTIYDDFIDNDARLSELPVANRAHRRAVASYGPSRLVSECFDRMDAANAWELERCRFTVERGRILVTALPDYADLTVLAHRAGAHILGPQVYVMNESVAIRRRIDDALTQYLIARQLNDDMHDWVDDLRAGHINPVVAHLMQAAAITEGWHDIAVLTRQLKRVFWDGELRVLCNRIIQHIEAVYRLERDAILAPHSPFIRDVIRPIRDAAVESLHVHTEQQRFLQTYRTR